MDKFKSFLRTHQSKLFRTIDDIYALKEKLFFNNGFDKPTYKSGDVPMMLMFDEILMNHKLSDKQVVDKFNKLLTE